MTGEDPQQRHTGGAVSAPGSCLRVSCLIPDGMDDFLAEVCGDFRCLGSELRSRPLGRQLAMIYLKSEQRDEVPALQRRLELSDATEISVGELPAEDWLENYRSRLNPFCVGRRWYIDPLPGKQRKLPEGRIRLVMEPRMAFGSGSHETTQLMLEAIEEEDLKERTVLDVGAGSGVLCLAALYCGAAVVVGLDIDFQTMLVARQLLEDQDAELSPLYLAGSIEALGECSFDTVLCNMITRHSLPVIPAIVSHLRPSGGLLLSGLLEEEISDVVATLQRAGLKQDFVRSKGEWSCLRMVVSG